jgi:hypothetical protein
MVSALSAAKEHTLGPVSATLVAGLHEDARKHGVLVWLDKDGTYSELVDSLIALCRDGTNVFPYPLFAYRGSFLELMLMLDGQQDGVTMQPLVLHMPGFNEEDIARTPVYELYCSGRRHRIALPTLIRNAAQGKVTPAEIDAGLETGLTSLKEADVWLDAHLRGDSTGLRQEISANSPARLFDDLVTDGGSAERLDESAMLAATRHYLERTLGLGQAWAARSERGGNVAIAGAGATSEELREQLQLDMLSWALCVEFVHDLKRDPMDSFLWPLKRLPTGVIEASRALAVHIRATYPDLYMREADRVETELEIECRQATAEDLGQIDTFRFEDKMVLKAALVALREERWDEAAAYAADRSDERSFWVQRDEARRTGWKLVGLAARLGAVVSKNAGLLGGVRNLEQVAERYARGGCDVDRAHRKLEQARVQLPIVRLEEFPVFRQCLNGIREVYRCWADEQALAFNTLCRKRGFLPESALQQRTLFEDCVRPLAEDSGTVAYFCVDALRFEMGKQLADSLGKDGKIQLQPRFAELPTLTEVGMNVLAPVCREGRLQPEINAKGIQGFRAGQSLVGSPESRRKAMHERVGGETCPKLSINDLLDKDVGRVRKTIARALLVVVHSDAIDKAGEEGLGLRHFDEELVRIRAAIGLLRDAGVKNFVITADHGFLLHDDTTRKPIAHGRKVDAKRRYVIETAAADHAGESRVSSTELRYDGDEVQFMFPSTTMPFDIGTKTKDFVHGGNSLQERLIPVITARYKVEKGATFIRYRVDVQVKPDVMGLHRIEGSVLPDEGQQLSFTAPSEIELRLQALDGSGVSVELVDATGGRIEAGVLVAPVDATFELFFRLSGPQALRTRVVLCAALRGDEVVPFELDRRFAVEVLVELDSGQVKQIVESDSVGWLDAFTEAGVRDVFQHIERFGAINEADATGMLGGPRKFRRFSQRFEAYAELVPFSVRIDTSSGQKRYVSEDGRNDE